MSIFSVENIAFTVLGYPISYVELVGTLLYLLSVWLVARRNLLTWPIGIASVILYLILFYQIRLYADTVEQVYYLFASVYGWWAWGRTPRADAKPDANHQRANLPVSVRYTSLRVLIFTVLLTFIIGGVAGAFLSRADVLLPAIFPAPAAYPLLDAMTTVMSFTAMALMALRRTESWIYWIIVDVVGIGLYFAQGVRFVSLLYVVLLILAIRGLIGWHRASGRGLEPPADERLQPDLAEKLAA